MVEYSLPWDGLPRDSVQISQDVSVEQIRKSAVTLASLLDEKQEEQVLKEACLGLCQLFGEGIQNDRIQAILEANVVPKLVGLLRNSKSRSVPLSVQLTALQVLGNVACGDDQQTQVVIDSDALPCLRTLLSSSDRQIRKEVCWIISNITESSHQVQDVLDADILPPLLKLLENQDAACREDATWVLFNLSSNRVPKQIAYLAEKNGVRALCNLLLCQKELDVLWKGCGTVAAVALKGLRNILISGEHNVLPNSNNYNTMAALVAEAHGVERIEALTNHASLDVRNRARLILERIFGTEATNCDLLQTFPSIPVSALHHSKISQSPSSSGQKSCSCDYALHQPRQDQTNSALSFHQGHGLYNVTKGLDQSSCGAHAVLHSSQDMVDYGLEHGHHEPAIVDVRGSTSGSSTDSEPDDDDSDSDLIPPRPAPCCCLLCTDSSPLTERRPRSKGSADDSDSSKMHLTDSGSRQQIRPICDFCSGCGRLGDGRAGLAAKLGRAVRLGHSHCLAILLSKMNWNQRVAATEAPALLHPGGGPSDHGSSISLPAFILAAQLGKPLCLELLLKRCRPDLDVTHGKKRLTALAWAAHKGFLRCCQLLIEHGAKSWTKCGDGVTALHLAASGGFSAVCKLLLDNNAPVNSKSSKMQTPLCLATQRGFSRIVQLLLDHGANPNNVDERKYTPLHLSASNGFSQIVDILLNHGAHVDAITRNEVTPLHYAVQGGHPAVVKCLISAGANVNCNRKPLLLIAADDGKSDIVSLLLDAGASVGCKANIRAMLNKDTEVCDYLTPLHLASSKNNHEVVDVLLRRGANVNEQTSKSGWSALDFAVLNGHSESAVILLQHNSVVTDTCKGLGRKNWTLVQYAASNGAKDVVRLLIQRLQEQRAAVSQVNSIASTSPFNQPPSLRNNSGSGFTEPQTTNGSVSTPYVIDDTIHTCRACSKLKESGAKGNHDEYARDGLGDQGPHRYGSLAPGVSNGSRIPSQDFAPDGNATKDHQSSQKKTTREDRQNTLRTREMRKREAEAREARGRLDEAISQRSAAKLAEAISHVSRLVLNLAAGVGSQSCSGQSEKEDHVDCPNEAHSHSVLGHSSNQGNSLTSPNASFLSAPLEMEVGLGNEVRKARKILASLQAEERRAREEKEREVLDSKRENAHQMVKKAISTALEGGDPRSLSRAMNRAIRTVLDKEDPIIVEASSVISLISRLEKQAFTIRKAIRVENLDILTESLPETRNLVDEIQKQGGSGTIIRIFEGREPSLVLEEAKSALNVFQERRELEKARYLEAVCHERDVNEELSSAMQSDDIVRLEEALIKAQEALLSKESQLAATIEAAKKVMGRRVKAERRRLRQAIKTNDPAKIEKAASEAEEFGINALRHDIDLAKSNAMKLREQAAAVRDLKRAISHSDVALLSSLRLSLNSLGMFNEAETARSELERLQRAIRARSLLQAAVHECQCALSSIEQFLVESQHTLQITEKMTACVWPDIQRLRDLSDRARQHGPSQYALCDTADDLAQRLAEEGRRILGICLECNDARAIATTITSYEEAFVRISRREEFHNDANLNAINAAKTHLGHIQAIEQASIKAESAQVKVEYALATSRRSAVRNRQCKGMPSRHGIGRRVDASRSSHGNANDPSIASQTRSQSPVSSVLVDLEAQDCDSIPSGHGDKEDLQSVKGGTLVCSRTEGKCDKEDHSGEDATSQDSNDFSPSISAECSHFYFFKEGATVYCARCGNHRSSGNPEWLARVKRRGSKIVQGANTESGEFYFPQKHRSRSTRLPNSNHLDLGRHQSPHLPIALGSAREFMQVSMPHNAATVQPNPSSDSKMTLEPQQIGTMEIHGGHRVAQHTLMSVNACSPGTNNSESVHLSGVPVQTSLSPDFFRPPRDASRQMKHLQDAMTYGSNGSSLNLNPSAPITGMSIGPSICRQGLSVVHASTRIQSVPMMMEEPADGSRDLGLDFANENFGFDIDAIVEEPILPIGKPGSRTNSDVEADVSSYSTASHNFYLP